MHMFSTVRVAIFVCAFILLTELLFPISNCGTKCVEQYSNMKHEEVTVIHFWEGEVDFFRFDNETGTSDGRYIVPNYVHFIKFGNPRFHFTHIVCILAAFKNQKPEKIFIHTDQKKFLGKYWDVLLNTVGFIHALVIHRMKAPSAIFGQRLQPPFKYQHAADFVRLQVLMKYGGIYVDNDCYIVRSLDDFRRYEMTIGWPPGKLVGNQILIAHKDARFLRIWYNSYRHNYRRFEYYFNAGIYPTQQILGQRPYLVHRENNLLGTFLVRWNIFMTEFPEWRNYYNLHLGIGAHINLSPIQSRVFNEVNVLWQNTAFKQMCLAVYPFTNL